MEGPNELRLQRQAVDAAKRLARTSGEPTIAVIIHDVTDGMGVAYAVEGPRPAQIELALFILLNRLSDDLQLGSAEGCETCMAAYARVGGAIAALAPGFGPGTDIKGRC